MMPYRLQLAADRIRERAKTLRGMAHLDRHDPAATVLLAGSGRSGTTWLGQIINHANSYRDVFEPFHPQHVKRVHGWPMMRYLPADDRSDPAGPTVKALLAGRIRSKWTDRYNRRALPERRLVKAIRVNLMLGWVARCCPGTTMLYAMRHPCAVVHSRVKLGWSTHLDQMLAQPALMRDHLEPYREIIERAEHEADAWTRHATMWCIENAVPLRELSIGDAHILFYERFCDRFDEEVQALFDYLGTAVPDGVERARRKHSAHFRRDSAILRGGDLTGDWRNNVSLKQLDTALTLLHAFGLDHLYGEAPTPLCHRDDAFVSNGSAHLAPDAHSCKEAA